MATKHTKASDPIAADELKNAKVKEKLTSAANGSININEELAHPAAIFLAEMEHILNQAYLKNRENLFATVASILIENRNLNQSVSSLNKDQLNGLAQVFTRTINDIAINNREMKNELVNDHHIEEKLKQAVDVVKTPRASHK